MTDLTADLDTEVRRLRLRIIGLTTRDLDETVDSAAGDEPLSRRETIAEALAAFSRLGSGGRPVPVLGDQSLADQVVVLLDHGAREAHRMAPQDRDDLLTRLLEAATRLRRALA